MNDISIDPTDLPDDFDEQMKMIGRYGIYDKKDNVWLGDENGPKVYEYFLIARVAAQVLEDQIFGNLGMGCRYEAREIPDANDWRKRDEVKTQRTTLEALIRCEGGKEE